MNTGRYVENLWLDIGRLSNTGMVRVNNEDCCYTFEDHRLSRLGTLTRCLFIVADGMGGHTAGEIASNIAVETIYSYLLSTLDFNVKSPAGCTAAIRQGFSLANELIFNMGKSKASLALMGTTATLGLIINCDLYVGHVGDSRAYIVRHGSIKQLTRDHSLMADLIKAELVTAEEAKVHPERKKINRYLGKSPAINIDTLENIIDDDKLTLVDGDSIIFCTDGLTGHLTDEELTECISPAKDALSACGELITLANLRGGEDNISVIVVKAKEIK
jgi:protein phosphatase